MNINIQVDKSLFSNSNGGGNIGAPVSGQAQGQSTNIATNISGNHLMVGGGSGAGNIGNSPNQQRTPTYDKNSLFPNGGGGGSHTPNAASQNFSQQARAANGYSLGVPPAVLGPQSNSQLLTVNNGMGPGGGQIPALQSQRSGGNLSGISQNDGGGGSQGLNSGGGGGGNGGAEQISVNVTITKMGNNVIQSRVDISKQPLYDEINYDEHSQPQSQMQIDEYGTYSIRAPHLPIGGQTPSQKDEIQLQKQLENEAKRKQKEEEDAKWMEKFNKYDKRSLFIFSNRWCIRQYTILLIRWKYYDYFMILSIIGNSFCLALTDYADDSNLTTRNQVLDKVDQIFTAVYTCEAILKIMAFGFVIHSRSYMRDPWNVLDFCVVIIGLISLMPSLPNLKSLRTMRVLRPLRSINTVPSLKRLVKTLLLSLPQMGYLVLFLLFSMTIMAQLGMQMFTRNLWNRCRLTPAPVLNEFNQTIWEIDEAQQSTCGGLYECNPGTYCGRLLTYGIPLDEDHPENWDFIQYGYFNFDNIGLGILSIFRVFTLEGWTGVMYSYMDCSGIAAAIFFPMLVILGSFFLLNLFLAVIMETFAEMNTKQQETERQKEEEKLAKIKEDLKNNKGDDKVADKLNDAKQKLKIQKGLNGLGDAANFVLLFKQQIEKEEREAREKERLEQGIKEEDEDPSVDQLLNEIDGVERKKKRMSKIEESSREQLNQSVDKDGSSGALKDNEDDDNESVDLDEEEAKQQKSNLKLSFDGQANFANDQEKYSGALSPFSSRSDKKQTKFSFESIRSFLLIVCESSYFVVLINLSIIFNTLVLSLDSYPQDEELFSKLDVLNIIFFCLFFLEMVIKIIGMGPKVYVADAYNIFDAFIVTLSIIDVTLSYSVAGESGGQGRGAISAFRAFRLFRVFKLAKSWKKLQKLLETILQSLKDISSFSVLLFLLMFIYVLLGMEAFAKQEQSVHISVLETGAYRLNFNNFLNGFVVVFTILTGENWDQTMFELARLHGSIAIFYFVSLIIIGQMIFLNLFLAILLENFEGGEEEDEESIFATIYMKTTQLKTKVKNLVGRGLERIEEFWERHGKKKSPKVATETNPFEASGNASGMIELANESTMLKLKQVRIEPGSNNEDGSDLAAGAAFDGESIIQSHQHNRFSGLEIIVEQNEEKSPSRTNAERKDRDFTIGKSSFAGISSGAGAVGSGATTAGVGVTPIQQRNFPGHESQQQTTLQDKGFGVNSLPGLADNLSDAMMIQDGEYLNLPGAGGTKIGYFPGEQRSPKGIEFDHSPDFGVPGFKRGRTMADSKSKFADSFSHNNKGGGAADVISKIDSVEPSVSNTGSPNKLGRSPKPINMALIINKQSIKAPTSDTINVYHNLGLEGNSLIFFSPENKFRFFIAKIVKSKYFEMFILTLIAISSILLALDNPLNDPESNLVAFLRISDIILTIFFLFESVSKIITFGFALNSDQSYLRNGWNVIDFIVVIVSVISLSITSNKLKIVKILRLLRVLRPLRVISRNKGLKIGIQALFMAIPSIFNVIIVGLLFFLIFGIIGVNYFKGQFFSCQFSTSQDYANNIMTDEIVTKFDCLNYGASWVNADQIFDNVPQAMSTLFQMSTTEGWVDVMNQGIDSVSIDFQPQINNGPYWSLFFISFIILGHFLILNLFAGVVVSTFNREKEILGKNYLLTERQRMWLDFKKTSMNLTTKRLLDDTESVFQARVRALVQSKAYDLFILSCIILNTITFCINWYSQPVAVDNDLDFINYTFAVIYFSEAVLKIIGFGFRSYIYETGNQVDFAIVVASIITTIVSFSLDIDFGSSATFIRALRITKILKYTKPSQSRQIKVIFETLYVTIPALTNIGGLLVLFLYIYSVLGVFLFSEVQLQTYLNTHANFQSFGTAFLTLLRCSTGEAWNYLMKDVMRQQSIVFECSEEDFDYDVYRENGYQTTGCGSSAAGMVFFMTYFLMVPLIFLNLFIAIILEGFEQTNAKVSSLLQEEDFEKFRDHWALFDNKGTGFIKMTDFSQLMLKLGEPLGWSEEEYKDNLNKQEDFLEEMNIPTYNNFQDYLYWDVLLALIKVYMVKMDLHGKLLNGGGTAEVTDEDVYKTENSQEDQELNSAREGKKHSIDPEHKLRVRLELEFEYIDDEKQGVMDVEEIKLKEMKVKKNFLPKKDLSYTSAHLKAGRKIMLGLKRLRDSKREKLAASELRKSHNKNYSSLKKKRGLEQQQQIYTERAGGRAVDFKKRSSSSLLEESVLQYGTKLRNGNEEEQKAQQARNISSILREYEETEGAGTKVGASNDPLPLKANETQNTTPFKGTTARNEVPHIVLKPAPDVSPSGQPSNNQSNRIVGSGAVPGGGAAFSSPQPIKGAKK